MAPVRTVWNATFIHKLKQLKALRVILYIDASKINWYNENNLHPQVLKALQPIVLNHLVSSEQGKAVAKRRKDLETARAFDDRTYLDMCDCVASNLLFYCSKFQNDLSLCLARYSPIHVTKGERAVWPLFFFFL